MIEQIINYMEESCPWQDSLLWFDTIDSTNTYAKKLAAEGASHGTVVIANHQTGGRGRMGRSFHSPAGTGLYMSVILRPQCAPDALMHLTCATAVAACDAIENAVGIRPGIKWTNDLVFQGRKLAGILTELGLSSTGTVDYAVIGIGINCTQQPEDFPEDIRNIAGSLSWAAGNPVNRYQIAACLINKLFQMQQHLVSQKQALLQQYRSDCITLRKDISLLRADGSVRHGKALDIDDEYRLLVRFENGDLETVSFGEVSIRGMYGYCP